jgi:transposase-like protein
LSKINILLKLLLIDIIMSVSDLQEIVCPNPECEYYLREAGKAIIRRGKYKTGHQRYNCKHCGRFFMDTVGTAIYRKHLSKDEIKLIYRLFLEKNGIRSIERITGHHRDTVSNLIRDTVRNEKTEEYLVKQIGLTTNECDKLWAILERKRSTSQKST